ncbi:MAG: hypothetical protein QG575_62 [Euryarchaeota archaeon]|nr:hypothetical protein [Euryarchaeota archaeon]
MVRFIVCVLIILAIINLITATDAKAQDMPSSTASTEIGGTDPIIPENNGIKILGIDRAAFPKIKVNIFIDNFCAMYGDIKKEDFKIKEDENDTAIRNFYFTGNATGQKLDLAIVFDETTSMDSEINALKSKIRDLTQKINSSSLDARYSLVTFNGADVATKINWTDDAGSFRNAIGRLTTSGGNPDLPENSLDGIERALSFVFRPEAQKIIIVATDEPSLQKGDGKSKSVYAMDDVKMDLLKSGAMLIAVSPDFRNAIVEANVPRSDLAKYADMRVLANESASLWIDIKKADFSEILRQIQGILTGTYVIEYISPNLAPSENRTVSVSINAPGCLEGEVSGTYTLPGSAPAINVPPVITSLTSNKASPQQAGTVILWTANASDPDSDLILYRFFCSGLPATDWQLSNQWPWSTMEGEFQVEVRVRDGMHAGPNETDDKRSETFKINAPAITEIIQEPLVGSWQKTFGGLQDDIGAAVLQNSDGGYTMTGHTSSYGAGGMDIWMIRTDAAGNVIWSRTFGGKDDEFATCVQRTSDDGYIMIGITSSYGLGGRDLWMVKTDALGNRQWDKTFGGAWDDGGISVRQTRDGGYIATGATGSFGPSSVWLIKTDASGDEEWNKTLDFEGDVGQMSTGSSVQQTDDGGYIVAGDSSKESVLMVKTDALGNKQWVKIFGGLAVDGANVNANSRVLQTSDGGYIIDSYTSQSGAGRMDLWLIRTDAAGNAIWSKAYGGKGDDFGTTIQQTSDGGYIIAGQTSSHGAGGTDLWLIKIDAAGNEIWSRTYGGKGDDFGTAVQQTTDGGYIMTGRTSSYGAGGMDLWMIKTDANGNVEGDKESQPHIFDSNYRI